MSVVVGYVQTPEGRAALSRGIEEARIRNMPLHLVRHVPYPKGREAQNYAGAVEDRARELEAVAAQTRIEHGIETSGHVPFGAASPADAVLEVADRVKADLIVIGLRRRSPVGKLVLGSSSQDIMLHAECPVLGVKAPEREPTGEYPTGPAR